MHNSESTVDYAIEDGIASLYLNRPHRLNAVTPELVADLYRALEQATRDKAGAAVLAGRGRAFCAGHDLRQKTDSTDEAEHRRRLQAIQNVTRAVRQAPFPVIAAVHGYALGAGCEFALCSDLIVAAEDATFGFPEVGVGLSVTGGISHILPLCVGLPRAKELILLGEEFGAQEAASLGLINRVVPPAELYQAALKLATTLRDRPRLALSLAKSALDRGAQSTIETAYEVEIDHALATSRSYEAQEAAERFRSNAARPASEEQR